MCRCVGTMAAAPTPAPTTPSWLNQFHRPSLQIGALGAVLGLGLGIGVPVFYSEGGWLELGLGLPLQRLAASLALLHHPLCSVGMLNASLSSVQPFALSAMRSVWRSCES